MNPTMKIYSGLLGLALTASLSAQAPVLTTIYSSDGKVSQPSSGVAIGAGGVLYGTTFSNQGTPRVYALTPPVSEGDPGTNTTLYTFPNGDGGLVIGAGGVL